MTHHMNRAPSIELSPANILSYPEGKDAMTASPTYFSTCPPCDFITELTSYENALILVTCLSTGKSHTRIRRINQIDIHNDK